MTHCGEMSSKKWTIVFYVRDLIPVKCRWKIIRSLFKSAEAFSFCDGNFGRDAGNVQRIDEIWQFNGDFINRFNEGVAWKPFQTSVFWPAIWWANKLMKVGRQCTVMDYKAVVSEWVCEWMNEWVLLLPLQIIRARVCQMQSSDSKTGWMNERKKTTLRGRERGSGFEALAT